ncbi:hypothetical protein V5O48_014671 [Marasmius crinis-equi]|uniref:C2H2-type domain-containing protein n=1 Tax=Marasmius crinis-equi TaxID=585013 RepID=A0ABR3EWZ7_9AGAR
MSFPATRSTQTAAKEQQDHGSDNAHRHWDDYCRERAPRGYKNPFRSNRELQTCDASESSHALNNHDTLNHGNSNQTYNGSSVCNKCEIDRRSYGGAVVHVHVHECGSSKSSASTSPSRASISSDLPAPPSSQATSPSNSPPSSATTPEESKHRAKEMTQSQRYEYLLLDCQLGCPQWKPSPRRTLDEEYMPEIGSVGFFSDGLPFDTLFNITLPLDSPANRDGVPEGVDPPCTIQRRWLSVDDKCHERESILFRPKGAISHQEVHDRGGSRVFQFELSQQEGAMLMLPRGGTLINLDRTTKFQERIKLYWRPWYEFAVNEADLGDQQTLCLVTGVERCSTWGMAVWESNSSYVRDKPGTLELTVDGPTGACSWSFPPARCLTRTSTPHPLVADNQPKETVFVRGFWINRSDGDIGSRRPLSHSHSGGKKDGNGDVDDMGGGGGGGPKHPQGYSRGSSSSYSRFPAQTPGSGAGNTESSNRDSVDPPDESQVDRIALSLSAIDFDQDSHPCQLINNFALALISKAHPILLETGCIAFSHDEDWTSIVNDSDAEFLDKKEAIRRMSTRFKFVVEQDVIFPTSTSNAEKELIQRYLFSAEDIQPGGVIIALVEYRESKNLPEIGSQMGTLKTVMIDSEDTVSTSSGVIVSTSVSCSSPQGATQRIEQFSLDNNDQSPSQPSAETSPEDIPCNVPPQSPRTSDNLASAPRHPALPGAGIGATASSEPDGSTAPSIVPLPSSPTHYNPPVSSKQRVYAQHPTIVHGNVSPTPANPVFPTKIQSNEVAKSPPFMYSVSRITHRSQSDYPPGQWNGREYDSQGVSYSLASHPPSYGGSRYPNVSYDSYGYPVSDVGQSQHCRDYPMSPDSPSQSALHTAGYGQSPPSTYSTHSQSHSRYVSNAYGSSRPQSYSRDQPYPQSSHSSHSTMAHSVGQSTDQITLYPSGYSSATPAASQTRPYACDLCPLSFNRQHDLKRHRETHTGEKPYTCNGGCGKTFTRKNALKRHQCHRFQLVKGCGRPED